MNKSRILFYIIAGILITLSCFNVFEKKAFTFSRQVTERNLEFLEAVEDVKLVMEGMSDVDIPFVSGHTKDLNNSLDKTESYLLKSNAVSFVQLMVISISKSWLVKFILIGLFVLSLFPGVRVYFSKLLVLGLILVPGLSIFSVCVQTVAQHSSIDLGDKYITELQAEVKSIKTEHAQLMQEHEKQETAIRNGDGSINKLKRLKEDVSYDFKNLGADIKGEYPMIRTLIRRGGHDMVSKISNFCTMIIFCLILMPLGYLFICSVTYKHLFNRLNLKGLAAEGKTALNEVGEDLHSKSFMTKLKNAFVAGKKEFGFVEKKIEESDPVKDLKTDIDHLKSKLSEGIKSKEEEVKSKIEEGITDLKTNVVKAIEEKFEAEKSEIEKRAQAKEAEVKSGITDLKSNIVKTIEEKFEAEKSEIEKRAQAKETEVKSGISDLKSDIVKTIEEKFVAEKSEIEKKALAKEAEVKEGIQNDVSKVKADIHDHFDQYLKSRIEDETNKLKSDASAEYDKIKDLIEQAVEKKFATVSTIVKDKVNPEEEGNTEGTHVDTKKDVESHTKSNPTSVPETITPKVLGEAQNPAVAATVDQTKPDFDAVAETVTQPKAIITI